MLNLLVIRSNDMEALATFYSLLGFNFEYHQHGKGPFHYAAERDGLVLEIYPETSKFLTTRGLRLGFGVNNLDAVLNKIEAKGGRIIQPLQNTEYGETAIVADPDGRKVELKERD